MARLQYNEITPKKVIIWAEEPVLVLSSHVFRKQKSKPVNITKLRNLISGNVIEQTFHQSDTVEEADLDTKEITLIYRRGDEYWFYEGSDKSKRFSLSAELIGEQARFIKDGDTLKAVLYENDIIDISIPIKVALLVTEAAPAVKGNTSSGALKSVTVESGTTVQVPLFINEGDVVRINTETGEYAERVTKG